MKLQLTFGISILLLGFFLPVGGEDIQIHSTNTSVLIDGEEVDCDGCSPLVLGHRLDLNQASVDELVVLPRIGEKKAALIVALREDKGGFTDVAELDEVRGIGEKTVLLLEPYLVVR